MRNYNRNSRPSGGRRGGGSRRRDSGYREMHAAVCDNCGNSCEVPFRPSGDKPIYCSSCFEAKDGGGSRRPGRRDHREPAFRKRDDINKQLLDQVGSLNTKLDRILKVLEFSDEKKSAKKKDKVKKVVKKTVSKDKKNEEKKSKKKDTEKSTPKKTPLKK